MKREVYTYTKALHALGSKSLFPAMEGEADLVEVKIRYYFGKNYQYKTILALLEKFHDITISKRTLLNKLKDYGLCRRRNVVDQDRLRDCIQQELDGSGQLLGYRAMWRRLQSKYAMQVPRLAVQTLLREMDPEGSRLRRAKRLRRRNYLNPGPNYCWHADGYDKLKPYGFPIHGCIDGFSRRILWLEIVRSNNDPNVVGNLFLNCVNNLQFYPTVLGTDRGTENGIMATIQCFCAEITLIHFQKLKKTVMGHCIVFSGSRLGGPCCVNHDHHGG